MQASAEHVRSLDAIAARLVATRKAIGLNQRQLCARAGIETNTYNQWEKAKNRPDLDKAIRLCEEFDLTLDWIYRGIASHLPHELALKLAAGSPDEQLPLRARGGLR